MHVCTIPVAIDAVLTECHRAIGVVASDLRTDGDRVPAIAA